MGVRGNSASTDLPYKQLVADPHMIYSKLWFGVAKEKEKNNIVKKITTTKHAHFSLQVKNRAFLSEIH